MASNRILTCLRQTLQLQLHTASMRDIWRLGCSHCILRTNHVHNVSSGTFGMYSLFFFSDRIRPPLLPEHPFRFLHLRGSLRQKQTDIPPYHVGRPIADAYGPHKWSTSLPCFGIRYQVWVYSCYSYKVPFLSLFIIIIGEYCDCVTRTGAATAYDPRDKLFRPHFPLSHLINHADVSNVLLIVKGEFIDGRGPI
jgi:hypothetical protein